MSTQMVGAMKSERPVLLMSIPDAAAELGSTPEFLEYLGRLTIIRIGRREMVPTAEVDRIARKGTATTKKPKPRDS